MGAHHRESEATRFRFLDGSAILCVSSLDPHESCSVEHRSHGQGRDEAQRLDHRFNEITAGATESLDQRGRQLRDYQRRPEAAPLLPVQPAFGKASPPPFPPPRHRARRDPVARFTAPTFARPPATALARITATPR